MHFYTAVGIKKNNIYVSGYYKGKKFTDIVDYKPFLFVDTDDPSPKYKTIEGRPVKRIEFDSISEGKNFIYRQNEIENSKFYGLTQFAYSYIYENYPGEIKFDPKIISTVILDLECAADAGFPSVEFADKEITAITLRKNGNSLVFGCQYYKAKDRSVQYVLCKNEADLLHKFLDAWESEEWAPDIVTGWNISFFDIPYLVNRISRILSEREARRLSPWGTLDKRQVVIMGNEHQVFSPMGVNVLDYLELYKKFSFKNQESYRLDFIGEVELDEKKLDYSEYGSLLNLYKENYEKFIDYNIKDCELVERLENKLKFIELVQTLAYDSKVLYADTLATVRTWDIIIHNYLLDQGIVVPQMEKHDYSTQIAGGFVKDPIPGMYNWVVSYDVTSLYPSLIMALNISPDTFKGIASPFYSVDDLLNDALDNKDMKTTDIAVAANGAVFSRKKQGFIPYLVENMFASRVEYRRLMNEAKQKNEIEGSEELKNQISKYHNFQLAVKIKLNSLYGAMANEYFRWFSTALAEGITLSGQLCIRWVEKYVNLRLNKILKTEGIDYVIAIDTDSVYINMEDIVKKSGMDEKDIKKTVQFLDKVCKTSIQGIIDEACRSLGDYLNFYSQKINMGRDVISNKGIWTAKKRYILNVWNSEGVEYREPKLKMMGIEAVRSSTPMACRKKIKEALEIIMNKDEDELIKFIDGFRAEFKTMAFEDIAFPRGISDIEKYQNEKSRIPIHVRGSILYNNLLDEKNLNNKYPRVFNKDKIKFLYLKRPNPIRENVIAAPSVLPPEFDLERFIDYDTQFEKAFLSPIQTIVDKIGWKTEHVANLSDFFS